MFRIFCLLLSFALWCCMAEYANQRHEGSIGNIAKILSYQYENTGTGPYRFAFATSDGIERQEEGDLTNPNTENEALVVRGAYSYTGPDGVVYTVRYTADENGFHPEGDHIKVPPYTPWDKQQQHEDESGYYTQANFVQKPVANVYLPGGQRSSFSNPQPVYGSSNTPKPVIAKYAPSRQRVYGSKTVKPALIQVTSTTHRPESFSPLSEIAYAPIRRNSGGSEANSGYQSSSLANSILEILGASDKQDDSDTVIKVEDINSL